MANGVAKGGLLGGKRPPFRDQKTTFCNTIRNTLIIKRLQSSPPDIPEGRRRDVKLKINIIN